MEHKVVKRRKTLAWPFSPDLSSELQTAKVLWAMISIPLPTPCQSKTSKTLSTCSLLTSPNRIFVFHCSKFTSIWFWQWGKWPCRALKNRPAIIALGFNTCVFTVCLTDLYKALKSNISCSSDLCPSLSFHSPNLAGSLNVPGLHSAGPNVELVHRTL